MVLMDNGHGLKWTTQWTAAVDNTMDKVDIVFHRFNELCLSIVHWGD